MKKKILLLAVLSFIIHCLLFINHCKAQWVQMSNGMGTDKVIQALASIGNNIFAGTYSGVYISTNNGTSWAQTALNNKFVFALAASDNNIFAGIQDSGVYISTNNGTSWTQTALNNQFVFSLAISGNNIFAGTVFSGVYQSTNYGTNWTQTALNNQVIYSLAAKDNNIFAGTQDSGVYISTNNGTSWTQTALNNKDVISIASIGNNIFAGTQFHGIYLSTNNGTNWAQTSFNDKFSYSLRVNESNIFAGTNIGVFISSNNGTNWIQKNQGFDSIPIVIALLITNNYIFAGTHGHSVWRRELSNILEIKKISSEIPKEYRLEQNYPNPFNPTTKIRFEVPLSKEGLKGVVSLKVFDLLGREVATLVNEKLNPSTYEVTFDARQPGLGSNLSSGVYLYRLTSGNFSETKKLILIK